MSKRGKRKFQISKSKNQTKMKIRNPNIEILIFQPRTPRKGVCIGGLCPPYKVAQDNSVEDICEPHGDPSSFSGRAQGESGKEDSRRIR
jgi:hypothetical protein